MANFWSAALEKPNPPPHTLRSTGGGAGTLLGAPERLATGPDRLATGPEKNRVMEAGGGTPRKILVAGVGKASPPHARLEASGGAAGRRLWGHARPLRALENFTIWQIGGNPWQNFGRQGPGMADTGLHHPHPPTRLDVLHTHLLPHTAPSLIPPHPLAHPVSSQGSGSPKGREDSRLGPHQSRSLRRPQALRP